MSKIVTGSCQCQEVRFQIELDCPGPIQQCHCRICQKVSGAPFMAFVQTKKGSLQILQGGRFLKVYKALTANRIFCTECGSNLFFEDERWPDACFPTASALDDDMPAPPKWIHIFSNDSPSWFPIARDEWCFEGYSQKSSKDWYEELGNP